METISIKFDNKFYNFQPTASMAEILEDLCLQNQLNSDKYILSVFDNDNNPVTNFKSITTLSSLARIIENQPFIIKIDEEEENKILPEPPKMDAGELGPVNQKIVDLPITFLVCNKKLPNSHDMVLKKSYKIDENLTMLELKTETSDIFQEIVADIKTLNSSQHWNLSVAPEDFNFYPNKNLEIPLPNSAPIWLHSADGISLELNNVSKIAPPVSAGIAAKTPDTLDSKTREKKRGFSFRKVARSLSKVVRLKSFRKKFNKSENNMSEKIKLSPSDPQNSTALSTGHLPTSKSWGNQDIQITDISDTISPIEMDPRNNSLASGTNQHSNSSTPKSIRSRLSSQYGAIKVLPSKPIAPNPPTIRLNSRSDLLKSQATGLSKSSENILAQKDQKTPFENQNSFKNKSNEQLNLTKISVCSQAIKPRDMHNK